MQLALGWLVGARDLDLSSVSSIAVLAASLVAGLTHSVEDMLLSGWLVAAEQGWLVAAEFAEQSNDSAVGSAVSGVPVS